MKTHDVLDSQKFKINLLCEEKINYIEKIWFLEFEFNLSLRETIFELKRLNIENHIFLPMRPFTLRLKCWMILLINVSPIGIRKAWVIF